MNKLTYSYGGAKIYRSIIRGKEKTFFLFLTDNDDELNYYALKQAQNYAQSKGFEAIEVLCDKILSDRIKKFSQYKINVLSEKAVRKLTAYFLLKSDAVGLPILDNIRLISLKYTNMEIEMLDNLSFFDKEYIVWTRLLCVWRYGDFKRTVPFHDRADGREK